MIKNKKTNLNIQKYQTEEGYQIIPVDFIYINIQSITNSDKTRLTD